MDENEKNTNRVKTTDSLEAINAFKSAKNLLFLLTLLSLLGIQAAFWAVSTGYIKSDTEVVSTDIETTNVEEVVEKTPAVPADTTEVQAPETEAAAAPVAAETETEPVADDIMAKAKESAKEMAPETEQIATEDTEKADIAAEEAPIEINDKSKIWQSIKPAESQLIWIVKVCNFVLIIASTLFCLVLLMSLKISLAGSMGGLNQISRGFIVSLFALALIMPWQLCFEGVICGAIFTPAELFSKVAGVSELNAGQTVMFYLRFVGLWALSLLFVLMAFLRSIKWSRTTLRRLGMMR